MSSGQFSGPTTAGRGLLTDRFLKGGHFPGEAEFGKSTSSPYPSVEYGTPNEKNFFIWIDECHTPTMATSGSALGTNNNRTVKNLLKATESWTSELAIEIEAASRKFLIAESFSAHPITTEWSDALTGLAIASSKLSQPQNVEDAIALLNSLGYIKCAERIELLRNDDDLEEGEAPLSPESVKTFLAFITDIRLTSEFKGLGEPLMGKFSQGTLSADWRALDGKYLLIEFHANGIVSFAMIDGKSRLNGRGTREEIISILRKQEVTSWKSC